MMQSPFPITFVIVYPCNFDCVIHFYEPKKGLSSLLVTIEILSAETLGCLLDEQSNLKIFHKSTEQHANVC